MAHGIVRRYFCLLLRYAFLYRVDMLLHAMVLLYHVKDVPTMKFSRVCPPRGWRVKVGAGEGIMLTLGLSPKTKQQRIYSRDHSKAIVSPSYTAYVA